MSTGNAYLDLFIAGNLGSLFYLLMVKLPKAKSRAIAANMSFSATNYIKEDWMAVAASFLAVVIGIFVFDELVGTYPSVLKYAKFFFIFVGYTGASTLTSVLSKFDKRVQMVVDVKTNIADNKEYLKNQP